MERPAQAVSILFVTSSHTQLRPRGIHSDSGPCHSYTSACMPTPSRCQHVCCFQKGPRCSAESFQQERPGTTAQVLCSRQLPVGEGHLLITHHLHSFVRGQGQTCLCHKGSPPPRHSRTRKGPPPLPRLIAIPAVVTASSQGVPELKVNCAFVCKALGTQPG